MTLYSSRESGLVGFPNWGCESQVNGDVTLHDVPFPVADEHAVDNNRRVENS